MKDITKYNKLRKEYLQNKSVCHAKVHNCTVHTTDIHHMKGRGLYLLNTSTWLPVCRSCHNWIENNPEESYELGFSLKRNE